MRIKAFEQGELFTNCYIVYNESRHAFCVDVSECLGIEYFNFIIQNNLTVDYLFLTHGHYDHCGDIQRFHKYFPNAKIVISRKDYENILHSTDVFCPVEEFVNPDFLVEEGDCFDVLEKSLTVMETPGHTSGSICFVLDDCIFCGDTVFRGSIGRSDLATGSFFEILNSLKRVLEKGDYKLYPGHMKATDTKRELRNNPYYKC